MSFFKSLFRPHLKELLGVPCLVAFNVVALRANAEAPWTFDACVIFFAVNVCSVVLSDNLKVAELTLFFEKCQCLLSTHVNEILQVNGAILLSLLHLPGGECCLEWLKGPRPEPLLGLPQGSVLILRIVESSNDGAELTKFSWHGCGSLVDFVLI